MELQREAKRMRLDPGPRVGARYKMQCVASTGEQLHAPHDVIFFDNPNKVSVNGKEPHGSWGMETSQNLLHVTWHWASDEKKAKLHIFARIPDTCSWLQVNSTLEWRNVLVPSE